MDVFYEHIYYWMKYSKYEIFIPTYEKSVNIKLKINELIAFLSASLLNAEDEIDKVDRIKNYNT